MPNNKVDYTFGQYRRSSLYFKRSPGAPIPKGYTWECPCGSSNALSEATEQYCSKCGTRLRLQEQTSDPSLPQQEGIHRYTVVRVAHFSVNDDGHSEARA